MIAVDQGDSYGGECGTYHVGGVCRVLVLVVVSNNKSSVKFDFRMLQRNLRRQASKCGRPAD